MDEKKRNRPRVLFLVQLPPPLHGVSVINHSIVNSDLLTRAVQGRILELDFAVDLGSLRRFTLSKFFKFFQVRRKLIRILAEFRPDKVYFSIMPVGWGMWKDLLFVRELKKTGVKTVFHIHNRGMKDNSSKEVYRKIYRYIFNGSSIIHLSQELLKDEILSAGIKPGLSRAIGNGIHRVPEIARNRADNRFRILFLSNLFPGKGIYLLPGILSELHKLDPEIEMHVVGDFMRNKYRKRLAAYVLKSGVGEQFVLRGHKSGTDKWKEYFNADVFLFPSFFRMECFPLVVLEAMQAGLPVVASSIGALPEIIDHGKNGYLVGSGDIKEYVNYLTELYKNPGLRNRFARSSRESFLQRFTFEKMENRIRSVLLA